MGTTPNTDAELADEAKDMNKADETQTQEEVETEGEDVKDQSEEE